MVVSIIDLCRARQTAAPAFSLPNMLYLRSRFHIGKVCKDKRKAAPLFLLFMRSLWAPRRSLSPLTPKVLSLLPSCLNRNSSATDTCLLRFSSVSSLAQYQILRFLTSLDAPDSLGPGFMQREQVLRSIIHFAVLWKTEGPEENLPSL